ncbi:hypothetical protein BDP27DRAFT_1370364 [Rhodocollybia butyracea]|uniref:Uncharacterized protein n=1 Tax=Rhodocollybia butyracea TaxID=206335 RepID=A0A9P5P975_9AGAR|nr:hypothetical protein BDP27DRAFT_1370364 [Rhodocollybia butyracea]
MYRNRKCGGSGLCNCKREASAVRICLGHDKELLKQYHSTGILIDNDQLPSIPATWKSLTVTLDAMGTLAPWLVKQVMWELYKLCFHLELITFNHYLVLEPQGLGDGLQLECQLWLAHEAKVFLCWPVVRFYEVVHGWPGPKPAILQKAFPTDHATSLVLEVEEALANYYIHVFVKIFCRLPTIPHIADPAVAQ